MNTLAIGLSAAGFVMVMTAWATYLATIPSGKVPARPVATIILQLAGMVAAVTAVVWSIQADGSAGVAVIVPAVFALVMGSAFCSFLSLRKTPIGDLKVKVGDTLLPFEATTSEGAVFQSGSLAGKRTLLKFFRGGW